MTLFESFTTPNDREWLKIRKELESKITRTSKEFCKLQDQIAKALEWQVGSLKTRKNLVEDQLRFLLKDYEAHIGKRTAYETAGKSQLALF